MFDEQFGNSLKPNRSGWLVIAALAGCVLWAALQRTVDPLSNPDQPLAVAFSPDGDRVASLFRNGNVQVWDISRLHAHVIWEGIADTRASQYWRRPVFFLDNETLVYFKGHESQSVLCSENIITGTEVRSVNTKNWDYYWITDPNRHVSFTTIDDDTIQIFDLQSGEVIRKFPWGSNGMSHGMFALQQGDGMTEIYNLKEEEPVVTLPTSDCIHFPGFADEGKTVITTELESLEDSTVRITSWDSATGARQLSVVGSRDDWQRDRHDLPNENHILLTHLSRSVVRDRSSGEIITTFDHYAYGCSVAISPDQSKIALCLDGEIEIRDGRTYNVITSLRKAETQTVIRSNEL